VAKARPAPPRAAPPKPAAPKPVVESAIAKAAPAKDAPPPAAAREVTKPGVEKPITIAFAAGSGSLPKPPPEGLDTLVRRLAADQALRIVIYAYANGSTDSASKARRLSFSRALAVRRYLVGKGVRGTRAEIRALGNKTTKEPADRVDLVLVKR
jgi:outer membrane protein OmpA-like peptidoglycan-associated protein